MNAAVNVDDAHDEAKVEAFDRLVAAEAAADRIVHLETPRDCRHEPPIPGAVTFAGTSDLVVHLPSDRCGADAPHPIAECEEFDRPASRTGGLVLCSCGHPLAYHHRRPRWHGGPLTDGAPCAYCACEAHERGEHQGLSLRQG